MARQPSDEQIAHDLAAAGLPPDVVSADGSEHRWFNDYGSQALRLAYLAGWTSGRANARTAELED